MSAETLPPRWATVEIKDLITPEGVFVDGDWIESKDQDPDGDVRLIQLADIGEGAFLDKSARFLTSDKAAELRCTFLKKGDVLIARMPDPLGRACIFPLEGEDRYVTVVDVCIIRTSPDIASSEFLISAINFLGTRKQIEDLQTGTTRKRISRGNLAYVTIPLPPLAEQKRIVAKIEELFSELEAGEESLRVARRQLGVYRQSLLKQAFEGKLTAKWRTQNRVKLGKPLTASTLLDVEPGPLPPGWIWQTLNEVADVTGGLTKNAKRDSLPKRIPYLRVANVYSNELRLDEIKDIGVTTAEAVKVRLVKGDLLIVEGNGSLDQIGRVAAWNGSIPGCGHQNHLIRARCHPNAHYAFVLMFLLSPHGRDVIEKQAASTSGLHTLSVSKVQRLPVPLCSLPEQQEIVRMLDEQFEVIERNEREIDGALRRSEALRQAILKKAFTGRLVPQDPSDEPASTLLARLRTEQGAAAAAPKPTRTRSGKPVVAP